MSKGIYSEFFGDNSLINYLSYTNANIFGKAYEFLRLRLCEKSLIFASLLEKDPIK